MTPLNRPVDRALVLGGGGTTGIAWEVGVLDALAAGGADASTADLVIGTSAGALVGAYLCLGETPHTLATTWLTHMRTIGRVGVRGAARLASGQFARDRHAWARRQAAIAADRYPLSEASFVQAISSDLIGRPWPDRFVVVSVSGLTGHSVAYDASSGIDLGVAVAASCAVPGVFPPVRIDDDPHLDGGVRSPANAHLAKHAGRALVLAPRPGARKASRRPLSQLSEFPPEASWLLVTPDATARRALGADPLDAGRSYRACEAGRRQGRLALDAAVGVWGVTASARPAT